MDEFQAYILEKKPAQLCRFTPMHIRFDTYTALPQNSLREPELLISHIISGLIVYFDRSLGANLLYRFERPQFADVRKQYKTGQQVIIGQEKEVSAVYGAEHLLRMIGEFVPLGVDDDKIHGAVYYSEPARNDCEFESGSRVGESSERLCERVVRVDGEGARSNFPVGIRSCKYTVSEYFSYLNRHVTFTLSHPRFAPAIMALRSAMKHSSRPTSPQASPAPHTVSLPCQPNFDTHTTHSLPLSPVPITPGYTPKVSFDTFENKSASMFSFTLRVKSEAYLRTRSTRVFLCAASADESGREALDWALEALVQDGDELIVFRGVDEEVLGEFLDVGAEFLIRLNREGP